MTDNQISFGWNPSRESDFFFYLCSKQMSLISHKFAGPFRAGFGFL